jgi:hypothetical protein
MRNKAALIKRLEVAHETLRSALADMDTEKEVCPGWTASELLAHISGWDEYAILWFRAVAAGDQAYEPAWSSIDALNDEFVAERAGLSYDELLQDCGRSRARLIATIADMPAEALETPLDYPWGGSGSVAGLALILAEHDEEHAAEIEAAKAKPSGVS